MTSSSSEVIFVTGANTGLGLEVLKALCQSSTPYTILLGSRTLSKGEDAIKSLKSEYPSTSSTIQAIQVDLTSDNSIEAAISTIQSNYGRLDVLVNNAGGDFEKKIKSGELSIREAWLQSWDTNVAGTQVLTTLAAPVLLKSSNPRLLFVTSGTSALTETERMDNEAFKRLNKSPKAGWPKEPEVNPIVSYRSAKAGLNMLMRDWARILREDGVKVWAISPGFLATNLGGYTSEQLKKLGALDPSVGGKFIVDVVEGKRDGDVGKVIRNVGIQPW